ncbi:MAG: hypothetical protein HY042_02525, partial [Spirochaetia bacterium]|nr:hypothetical protein [Spirochaetia bacterium]
MSAGPEFIKHMFRVIEAGARLRADMPWLVDDFETLAHKTGVIQGSLAFTAKCGDFEVRGPLGSDFEFEADLSDGPQGAYQVVITGRDHRGFSVEIWRQMVFVQQSLHMSPEEIDGLARRYAPVFLFSRKEEYYPVPLDALLQNPLLAESKEHIRVKTVLGHESVPVSRLFEFLRYNGHEDYLLDQSFSSFDESVFREIHGTVKQSVIYYSYQEDRSSGRFFINYHTFYAFDPKTGIAKLLHVGPHVFDRESLTVVFGADQKPESVVLSAHLEHQPILFLEKLKMWNTGRVRVTFADPLSPVHNGHPVVPVAEGSHALYPTAGLYHISALTELAGHIFPHIFPDHTGDDEPPEITSRQVLLPPGIESDAFGNYELR